MSYERQGLEYGFLRCSDMVRDAERRAMRHPTFEPRSRVGKTFYRQAANWLSVQRAHLEQWLHAAGAVTVPGE